MNDEDLTALRRHLSKLPPGNDALGGLGFLCTVRELLAVADAAAGANSSIGGSVAQLREVAMAAGWNGEGALLSWLRSLALPAPVMLTQAERIALVHLLRDEMKVPAEHRVLPTPSLSSLTAKLAEASRS